VIFFGLPGEGFQFGIWIWPLRVKNRLDVDNVMPLCERNMEGLAKDWGEEKRRDATMQAPMAAKVVLRMDPPGRKVR